ncbi:MAG: metalloregulator ArsR/SmtB family transcription factor [Micrococcaceae bacterium]
MVESIDLDAVFKSLSDPTRRDILKRLCEKNRTVGELAQNYRFSFAGVAKHIDVLEKAQLVSKSQHGKSQLVSLEAKTLEEANNFLELFEKHWEERIDSLGEYLKSTYQKEGKKS